ncbi:MAG: riboflavin synthase [Xanthomonadales bacterium]|nr:riboflavin synthase [Xanthomonadales bacterium]
MFTGIVTATGSVQTRAERGGDLRLTIQAGKVFLQGVKTGDSISVSGVCLTVTDLADALFSADISAETLACTTLGDVVEGGRVNLERPTQVGDRLDGHLVTGHVDGVATLVESAPDGRSRRLTFEAPAGLMRYIAPKGSVCLDGVSLTVNGADDRRFEVCVIPHTLAVTTLGELDVGQGANLEVDLVARYLERLLTSGESR